MKKKKCYIYLFRHGQTHFNDKHIFTGWKESSLTLEGKKEARVLAEKLRKKKIGFGFMTHLNRSEETLNAVLQFHPECRLRLIDDRMIERSYGTLEGMHHAAIIKKYGQKQFERWHRDYVGRPPGGESFADVEKRVKNFIADLKILLQQEKVNIAISAHGNSIRIFRKIMEKASVTTATKWVIPYTKVFVYAVRV